MNTLFIRRLACASAIVFFVFFSQAVWSASLTIDNYTNPGSVTISVGQFEDGFSVNGGQIQPPGLGTGQTTVPNAPFSFLGTWNDPGNQNDQALPKLIYFVDPAHPLIVTDTLSITVDSSVTDKATISGLWTTNAANNLGAVPPVLPPGGVVVIADGTLVDLSYVFLGGRANAGIAADLAVTVVDNSPTPVIAGAAGAAGSSDLTYTITNNGPGDASNVVADMVEIVNGTWATTGCTYTASQGGPFSLPTWNVGAIAFQGTATLRRQCPAGSATTHLTTVQTTLSMTSLDQVDLNVGNDSASTTVTIERRSNLVVTKVDSVDPVIAGGTDYFYTIRIENQGPSDADNVVATDTVPTDMVLWQTTHLTGIACAEHTLAIPTCSLGTMTAGSHSEFTADAYTAAHVLHGTTLTNSVSAVSDSTEVDADSATGTEDTLVNRESDISIVKSAAPDPEVVAGTVLTYTLTATNNGPSNAFDMTIGDVLPVGTTFATATPSTGGTCTAPPPNTNGTVDCYWDGSDGIDTPPTGFHSVVIEVDVDVNLAHNTILSNQGTTDSDSFDPNRDNNISLPPTLTTVITEAYWDVTKTWNRGDDSSVDIQLTCNDVEVASGVATPGAGPTRLTVTGFDNGNTACVVTETIPGGSFEEYSIDCSVDDVVSATVYACNIGNSESFATFAVRKRFMDGNDVTPVTFHMDCNNGLPTEQKFTVIPETGDFNRGSFEVKFVVTKFSPGKMDCTVYEEPVGGYTASYVCGSVNNPGLCTDGEDSPLDGFGTGPCHFEDVDSTGAYDSINYCTIRNYPNPGTLDVSKEWVVEGSIGNALKPVARIELESSAYVEGSKECNNSPNWCRKVMFDKGPESETKTLEVETSYMGTVIYLDEDVMDDTFESENDCNGMVTVYPTGYQGNDGMEQCTFTNTAYFEGIPTLNQYGMALLALLMLSVGLLGFRRFA